MNEPASVSPSAGQAVPLYDGFADYDRFVNWERRLAVELPFIERQLARSGVRRVLDVACGTGKHALALAERGYEVTGADLSAPMIERARRNATIQGRDVRFLVAGFGELAVGSGGDFDALLCLGNSLPHVLTAEALRATLADFAQVLRPGGLLLLQTRNFDAVIARQARWMPLQHHREGAREWLFLRFYDLDGDDVLTFNVVTLERTGEGAWQQRVEATRLRPWQSAELLGAVEEAGFAQVGQYGDVAGSPYEQQHSGNWILVARRV